MPGEVCRKDAPSSPASPRSCFVAGGVCSGHGSCTSSARCECVPGYLGPSCTLTATAALTLSDGDTVTVASQYVDLTHSLLCTFTLLQPIESDSGSEGSVCLRLHISYGTAQPPQWKLSLWNTTSSVGVLAEVMWHHFQPAGDAAAPSRATEEFVSDEIPVHYGGKLFVQLQSNAPLTLALDVALTKAAVSTPRPLWPFAVSGAVMLAVAGIVAGSILCRRCGRKDAATPVETRSEDDEELFADALYEVSSMDALRDPADIGEQ
eukprot:NODE_3534_length_959_cov_10.157143_g3245_i0.p1 GENE.NODE_3534_length_959_cov_10.157143_g3245_i0~~NODE_3534_length_959_cov_10.157143_g3245_i0.p1  ORF type:complete len:299 (-),score=44.59 NODE_3534_length_959_cov_10.157143_g3245_i0:62-853(-)